MPEYLAPGVYVEEVEGGERPIEPVGTSTAGFVGNAPNAQAHVNEAVAINNWSEFMREFASEGKGTPLAYAVYGFFQNGGSYCYVTNVAGGPISGGGQKRTGLDLLSELDDVAIVAAPGFTDAASYDAVLTLCETLEDRVAILDAPEEVSSIDALTKIATVTPKLSETKGRKARGEEAATDTPPGSGGLRARQSDGGYGAFYYPNLIIRDPFAPSELVSVAPSGHIAGIWARSDATRGVHKAPANETIRGALGLKYNLTRAELGLLNSNGVNCIRSFAQEGIRVWGARTLAASSSEWRYVNVRRLFNMVENSIARATNWIVFESNDYTLWKSISRDVSAFLTILWRDGALMGRTPEEAFFVKCDEETNPPEVINGGMVVILVGIAPVKPAEFVIFRISQWEGGVKIETQGGA